MGNTKIIVFTSFLLPDLNDEKKEIIQTRHFFKDRNFKVTMKKIKFKKKYYANWYFDKNLCRVTFIN